MLINKDDLLCFSIIVTGKCNLSCSYCHFYQKNNRKTVNHNISDDLFELYIDYIAHIQRHHHENIQVRFSGGEPLLIGDKLFYYSEKVNKKLNIKPYILTNGKCLNDNIIVNSKNNGISGFFVSLENPFDVAEGALNPLLGIENIKKYHSKQVQVKPAVVIVRNSMFKKLPEICDYFYSSLQEIPTITELNFLKFIEPTEAELSQLKKSIYKVVKKYFSKTELELFPYIVPELCYGYRQKYLVELNMSDNIGISRDTYTKTGINRLIKYLDSAYPYSRCGAQNCNYFYSCEKIKWVWKNNMQSYCSMKINISEAYYNALKEIL